MEIRAFKLLENPATEHGAGLSLFVLKNKHNEQVGILQVETKIENGVETSEHYLQLEDGVPEMIKRKIKNLVIQDNLYGGGLVFDDLEMEAKY